MVWINDKGETIDFPPSTEPQAANDRDLYQTLDVITELGWETHRAWEKIIGEDDNPSWDELNYDEKQDLRESVEWIIVNPTASIYAQHDAWRARTVASNPTHPNLVPYDELPWPQQMKARLWRHIILAIAG